jgi:hypothetical protein
VIRSGLTPGEQIVIDGQDKLQNGSNVVARPVATPSASSTSSQGQTQ